MLKVVVGVKEGVLTGKLSRLSHVVGLRVLLKKTGAKWRISRMAFAGDDGGIVCGSGAATVMRAGWRLVIGYQVTDQADGWFRSGTVR
jgi:hypothetical protein